MSLVSPALTTFYLLSYLFPTYQKQIEKLLENSTSTIIGYYYANESATVPRLAYIDSITEAIRVNATTGGSCLLLEISNEMLSTTDTIACKGTAVLENISRAVSISCADVGKTNAALDKMLLAGTQHKLADFEDHMDSADASAVGAPVHDFRNKFVDSAFP